MEMKEYELLQTKYKQQTDNYQQVLREKQKLIKSLTDCKQTLEVTAEKSKLVEEKYWAFRIGFSLNDRWFVKRKYN